MDLFDLYAAVRARRGQVLRWPDILMDCGFTLSAAAQYAVAVGDMYDELVAPFVTQTLVKPPLYDPAQFLRVMGKRKAPTSYESDPSSSTSDDARTRNVIGALQLPIGHNVLLDNALPASAYCRPDLRKAIESILTNPAFPAYLRDVEAAMEGVDDEILGRLLNP